MFARLFSNNSNIQTAYSEISRVITGNITSPSSLTAFNPSTSIIINNQPSGWSEYTSVGINNQVTAGSVIWFRQRNKSGRWKYAGIYRTSSPATAHKCLLRHYTAESPSVLSSNVGTATNHSEPYGASTEYTIAAGRGYLFIATKLSTNAHFTEVSMWLENEENGNGSYYSLPNHVLYRHYGTGTVYETNASTDLAYSTGIVECANFGGGSTTSVLNGGLSSPTTQQSTMKPSYFTSFSNTLDSLGSVVEYPIFPLHNVSLYHGFVNFSTLTDIWGAGHSISSYGSTVVKDGKEYVFIKANGCLSYLIPRM